MNLIPAILSSLLLAASADGIVWAAEPTWQEQQNLPPWAQQLFGEPSFTSRYSLTTRINPFFLHGDFNGDGKLDLAALIVQKTTGKEGIGIAHAGSANILVVGAGTRLGNGGDDFAWLDAWSVRVKQPVQPGASGKQRPLLFGDTLLVQKLEAASASIYWDGKSYRWHQHGD